MKKLSLSFLASIFFPLFIFLPAHAATTAAPAISSPPAVVQKNPAETSVININTVDASTLTAARLKGIGAKRATAIIAYREQHGPFKSLDDLTNVKGISQKLIDNNRSRLVLN